MSQNQYDATVYNMGVGGVLFDVLRCWDSVCRPSNRKHP